MIVRPITDQEVIQLTEQDFKNAEKFENEIGNLTFAFTSLHLILILVGNKSKRHVLTQQKYYRGDIRGKAAWGSVCL